MFFKNKPKNFDRNEWGYSSEEMEKLLHPTLSKKTFLVQQKGDSKIHKIDGSDFSKIFDANYISTCVFSDFTTFKRVMRSCSRMFSTGEAGEENRSLGARYREKLAEGWLAPVSIRWIDETLGYGLFAEKDLPMGSYMGEYAGMIRQINRLHPDLNGYCIRYPLIWPIFRYFVVDSILYGNELRFANHSFRPNLVPRVLVERRFLHTVFFTNQDIRKGGQLTFDYGADYWRKRQEPVLIH